MTITLSFFEYELLAKKKKEIVAANSQYNEAATNYLEK